MSGVDLAISRLIDAPQALVYAVWANPDYFKHWWGPDGLTTPVCRMDMTEGGEFATVMVDENGRHYINEGVFLEVIPQKRIVFTDAYRHGWVVAGAPSLTVIISFADEKGQTRYTAAARHWRETDRLRHVEMGFYRSWNESLERMIALIDYLKHH